MTSRILGTGSAAPEKRVTNDDLAKVMDTSDEWISSRTGIRARHIVEDNENVVTLAVKAGAQALQNAKVKPEDIDLVLVGTCTAQQRMPSVACQVQGQLGIANALAYDISAACSGFVFALNAAHAYIQAGICKQALVIGADTISRVLDWTDRSTCVLFGDGAGAAVVGSDEMGIMAISQHADGSMGHVLDCVDHITMDGQAVFKFAVKKVPECIMETLDQAGLTPDQVDHYVLHQANKRIIQSVAKRLKVDEDRFPMNLDEYGNTSAGSVPLLLDELNRKGILKKGDKVLMSGFGGGLTWGAVLLEW